MRVYLMLPVILLLGACSAPPVLQTSEPNLPEHWHAQVLEAEPVPGWLDTLNDPVLADLVRESLQHNPSLKAAREQLEVARQRVSITGADPYPALSLELGSRRQEGELRTDSLSFNLNWTPDLWGELAARTREALFDQAAAEAEFEEQREALVAELGRNWFALQEAQLLLDLYTRRQDNLQQNLEIIESGYRQGLNEALDLYLARNSLHEDAARVAQQRQILSELQRELERMLGRYPAAVLAGMPELALIETEVPAGLPADILRRRPDLQQQWLSLLATDAALAAAHRDRFPGLSLSADYGGSSDALKDLLSSGNLAWSLGASMVQTLFDAGRKEAVQAQALAERRQQEQHWLDAVYTALTEAENALSSRRSLQRRHALYLQAEQNALYAEELAFEQYRNGLESYTTVLEAQRRSLDAQTSVISLRRQLLENRIELHRALGGRFQALPAHLTRQTEELETP